MTLPLRRLAWAALTLTFAALPLVLLWQALSCGGWTVWEAIIWASLALTAPWIGNLAASSLIGITLLLSARDPLAATWPGAMGLDDDAPPSIRTAILVCIRNEDIAAVIARTRRLLDGLDAAGAGERFAVFVLSDTADAALGAAEEQAVARWRAGDALPARITYRRRTDNTGFKAGNIMEFVRNRAAGFEAMITLDADSVMTPEAVLRLARLMAANPRAALIQTLIVARPTADAFPRMFQFGMRHGMRAYAAGIAWWQGPDGPYWGHNAIIRIAPFAAHGALPSLPGGGVILSHDQVEAALLRGAGWEVRLDPIEGGSYEANPPTMLEFMHRDIRWMAGNLQYFALLRMPLFSAMGRLQLLFAIMLFAWSPLTVLAGLAALANALSSDPASAVAGWPGLSATLVYSLLLFSPKLLGALQAGLDPAQRARWGGGTRLGRGVALEFAYGLAMTAISAVNHSIGMAAMLAGRRIGWAPQNRDDARVSLTDAARALWWHTLIGVAALVGFAAASPVALVWAMPFILGPALAIPFCLVTADRGFGQRMASAGLCAIPEEFDPASPFPPLTR